MRQTQAESAEATSLPPLPLLQVVDLAVSFNSGAEAPKRAVGGVYLSVYPRQTLAIVGESGCGKSVTALSIMRLLPPTARIDRGSILFQGRDLSTISPKEMLSVRGAQIAMIFQEPMTSLNPVLTVGDQIVEAVLLHQQVSRQTAREIAAQAMEDVGISDALRRFNDYPHQFSGGMRQRVMIAMALACRPRLLIADEPTSALDVTIQAQILDLLDRLRQQRGMSLMLITHDLGLVARHADVVCVMYAGRVVEYGAVFDVLASPLHPYTGALLNCKPKLHGTVARLSTIGESLSERAALDPGALVQAKPNHWVAMPLDGASARTQHEAPTVAFTREWPAAPAVHCSRA
ncbi:MAG: ABC transporter ATP-binding protein [Phycisphaerales bacterium]|nr:ABC transporter ATP-binding protein [Phycisphaerales bacterium]MCI0632009.1 ABC transporter ATP-binding protein [Phycisphaerales bacterium]MCI0676877.1 ABC transporter ATP-binding protein [Phycisphaerales bacterium]